MPQLELLLDEAMGRNPNPPTEVRKSSRADGEAVGGGSGAGIVRGDLAELTRRKYLNYALSVITSRAIPDVRDGLKPVQRRILFTMFHDLHLTFDARHRKSAKVVGDVIGKYHPHGDTAVYDAMVRLAQDFNMRARLVDGQGNFGSIDGDRAAAYRYTESRLTKIAAELISEIKSDTVNFRATYDGTGEEPIVLPARFPQLLVNGTTGIAVGMATSIPPHNLGEVIKACLTLIDKPATSVRALLRNVRGPDFPTGGQLVATKDDLIKAYETGRGTFKLRGSWKLEQVKSKNKTFDKIVITAVPYAIEKAALVEEIGHIIYAKKLPQLIGIQDLSTTDVLVELELDPKSEVDPELIMAYLFKHTKLQTTVKFDLTCLVPTDSADVCAPARLDLKKILQYFLNFRFETITRRFQHALRKLEERIHILEGFEIIFDDLDRAIRIIRKSDGKSDAAKKLINAFEVDAIQADAVLETKLYKLAKLEIEKIRAELEDKRKQARAIQTILKSKTKLWSVVRSELVTLSDEYSDRRRTLIDEDDLTAEFNSESFIIEEDAVVLITKAGWLKRQRSINLSTTRMREGDSALALVGGSTRECVALFSNFGTTYVARINDIPASSGHGTPVQKLFKLKDGERIIGAVPTDPRFMEEFRHEKPDMGADYEEAYPHFLAATRQGMSLRFTLWPHREPSNTRGRLFGRLKKDDEFVAVFKVYAENDICALTRKGKLLSCNVMDVNLLAGAGRGVKLVNVEPGDDVIAVFPSKLAPKVTKSSGGVLTITAGDRAVTHRGGKGKSLFKRGEVKAVEFAAPELPVFGEDDGGHTKSKS